MIRTLIAALVVVSLAAPTLADELTPEQLKFFETKIRPVLIKECYGCHSNKAGNVRGGLRLDNKELTHIGGSSGPAVVPGDLEESLLFTAITHESFEMPPKRKLSPSVIDDFRQWIEMGAPDPRVTKVAEIQSTISPADVRQARETFWAYQKPVKVEPPADDTGWSKGSIDRYVFAKLQDAGLQPAVDAEPHQVLRRLCFDLVGLPPTPEQVEYFTRIWEQDGSDQAIELVVDRLLEKEQYGERWGRHWLDVARYAESTGREVNMTFPHAWRYRDYVIDSFNEDKPFDRFIQEQIAGDLLPVKTDQRWAQNLIATTFLAMGSKNVNEQNRVQFAADLADEQVDTTTRVFLGMSVACARCHDHKFDAIPQTDYYAMAGIFGSTLTYFGNPPSEYGSFSSVQARRNSSLLLLPVDDPNPFDTSYSPAELAELKQQIQDKLAEQASMVRNRNQAGATGLAPTALQQRLRLANELAVLSARLAVVDSQGQPRSYCMGVQDRENPQDVRVLVRGEIDQPGQVVQRGFPSVLSDGDVSIKAGSSGRLELAKWIGSEDNPLTARVMVNRIWQNMIGQGIVTSNENFGVTGQAPSHPELLDYLAVRFVQSGWSVKTIVREIASSHSYRISSAFDETAHQYDPDNALLWRANPRRLDAEAIRDAMLMVSGEIDFQRPRGSEVAQAGYVRVRDGVLGDPRERIRQQLTAQMGQQTRGAAGFNRGTDDDRRSQYREALRNRLAGGRPPGFQRPGFQRPGTQRPEMQRPAMQGAGGRPGTPGGYQPTAMQAMQSVAARITGALDSYDAKFRSAYLPIVREEVPRSLEVFDFPDASMVTGTRESSNTPNQALYLMNNPFVIQQSEEFAKRIAKQDSRMVDQIEAAFVLAYGRPPTRGEGAATVAFFKNFRLAAANGSASANRSAAGAMTAFCQSLLASAEFRYVD